MAAAVDAIGTVQVSGSGSSISIPITIVSNSNGAVVVAIKLHGTAQSVSSISGAGVSSYSSLGTLNSTTGVTGRVELWGGIAPSTGSQTVTVTLSAANADSDANAISFTGVDQSTPFAGFASTDITSVVSAFSRVVSTGSGDIAVSLAFCGEANFTTSSPGTQRWQDNTTSSGAQSQTAPASGSTVTLTENLDGVANGAICGVAVKAVAVPDPFKNTPFLYRGQA